MNVDAYDAQPFIPRLYYFVIDPLSVGCLGPDKNHRARPSLHLGCNPFLDCRISCFCHGVPVIIFSGRIAIYGTD